MNEGLKQGSKCRGVLRLYSKEKGANPWLDTLFIISILIVILILILIVSQLFHDFLEESLVLRQPSLQFLLDL